MKTYARNATGRMFENDFLEAASRVHPAAPFLFYVPIISGLMAWGLYTGVTTWGISLSCIAAGWLTWQLMEYSIHRFFFHWEGSGPITRRIHEIAHGYHHDFPDDGMRLVMPLGASIPLAIVIGLGLWLLGLPAYTLPYFVGVVGAYLVYDGLHYAVHHHKPRTAWGKALRAHHMAHHFAVPDKNFGISHRWLDVVAGSMRKRQPSEE